jgi:hypothetical protein
MKQQTNNSQSTTARALTSFPENPQLYIFAYTRMPEKISGDFKTSANFLRKYENSG